MICGQKCQKSRFLSKNVTKVNFRSKMSKWFILVKNVNFLSIWRKIRFPVENKYVSKHIASSKFFWWFPTLLGPRSWEQKCAPSLLAMSKKSIFVQNCRKSRFLIRNVEKVNFWSKILKTWNLVKNFENKFTYDQNWEKVDFWSRILKWRKVDSLS